MHADFVYLFVLYKLVNLEGLGIVILLLCFLEKAQQTKATCITVNKY